MHIHDVFVNIIHMYAKGNKTINELCHEVGMLFNRNTNLWEDSICNFVCREYACILQKLSLPSHTIERNFIYIVSLEGSLSIGYRIT